VYVLPHGDEALEDFEWLVREIVADGGEAALCEATFLAGLSNREVAAMFEPDASAQDDDRGPSPTPPQAATWVTRRGVEVDRIASAWLIRRFIDPEARFKFVPARGYHPEAGEVRFDMFEADYTHEGDACTFETLIRRFGLEDPALHALAELVHDVDCKDEKFGRAETPGFATIVAGIVAAHADDAARLERGAAVLDDLYAHLKTAV
jgi:hypothetical protein